MPAFCGYPAPQADRNASRSVFAPPASKPLATHWRDAGGSRDLRADRAGGLSFCCALYIVVARCVGARCEDDRWMRARRADAADSDRDCSRCRAETIPRPASSERGRIHAFGAYQFAPGSVHGHIQVASESPARSLNKERSAILEAAQPGQIRGPPLDYTAGR